MDVVSVFSETSFDIFMDIIYVEIAEKCFKSNLFVSTFAFLVECSTFFIWLMPGVTCFFSPFSFPILLRVRAAIPFRSLFYSPNLYFVSRVLVFSVQFVLASLPTFSRFFVMSAEVYLPCHNSSLTQSEILQMKNIFKWNKLYTALLMPLPQTVLGCTWC